MRDFESIGARRLCCKDWLKSKKPAKGTSPKQLSRTGSGIDLFGRSFGFRCTQAEIEEVQVFVEGDVKRIIDVTRLITKYIPTLGSLFQFSPQWPFVTVNHQIVC